MDADFEHRADLARTPVPQLGRLVATGESLMPYELVDPDGVAVEAVSTFFAELQAAGRADATLRSYGMDLLRWFRFLWALGVPWDRATRDEARDFSRSLQVVGKPLRPHWRRRDEVSRPPQLRTHPYAASVRAHSRLS
jgi:LPS sulfotransferase NodH